MDEYTDEVLTEPQPTPLHGIDETRRDKPRWGRDPFGRWTRVDRWDTGFVDLDGLQGLLGQAEGCTSSTVTNWLTQLSQAVRDATRAPRASTA